MLDAGALAGFALLGLAGSLHCVGMCGGFVLSVTASSRERRGELLARALCFGSGKALTYAVLGLALAALLGAALGSGEVPGLVRAQRVAAWIAGAALIALGLGGLGLLPRTRLFASSRLARALGTLLRRAEELGGFAGAFGAGVVTGFLPCGLSWGAFVLATQTDPATAAAGLFLFGLATTPSLTALALGWRALSTRLRTVGARALGLLLVVFGAMTLARGGPIEAARAGTPASCCPPSDSAPANALADGPP